MWIRWMSMIYLAFLAYSDTKKKELPIWLLVVGTIAGMGWLGVGIGVGERQWTEVLCGAVPGLILLLLAGATSQTGPGDGIVLLQLDLLMGMRFVITGFGLSMILIGVFSALLLVVKRGGRERKLPYIPFLWIGSVGAFVLLS